MGGFSEKQSLPAKGLLDLSNQISSNGRSLLAENQSLGGVAAFKRDDVLRLRSIKQFKSFVFALQSDFPFVSFVLKEKAAF